MRISTSLYTLPVNWARKHQLSISTGSSVESQLINIDISVIGKCGRMALKGLVVALGHLRCKGCVFCIMRAHAVALLEGFLFIWYYYIHVSVANYIDASSLPVCKEA